MAVLFVTDPAFAAHDPGAWHPERPARLEAVLEGTRRAELGDVLVPVAPRPATPEELARVHRPDLIQALEEFCAAGGGRIDQDTSCGPASWPAAVRAAGAGLDAVDRLRAGEADAAFCAVRPPGHHATPDRPMGFCLVNNVAVTAAALADGGERVAVVDWDAHHGNGTQDAFIADPRVLYVSVHEFGPAVYPGTGRLQERGTGPGEGTTVNVPLPPGSGGDAMRAAVEEVVVPAVERFGPTWLLVSAGFDSHRADPLTELAVTAGDFADIAAPILATVPAGRRIAFLEGGYDLDALADCAGACLAAMAGRTFRPEPASSASGLGRDAVAAARRIHEL